MGKNISGEGELGIGPGLSFHRLHAECLCYTQLTPEEPLLMKGALSFSFNPYSTTPVYL